MFSQLFGQYLVEQKVIGEDVLRNILDKQAAVRVRLGTIAIADGLLTEKQSEELNRMQTQFDKRFGDLAVEQGYLTEEQVKQLLDKQGNLFMKFIQLLFEQRCIDVDGLDANLSAFQKRYGFTKEDMEALKRDDVDEIVPLFAFASKPYVTKLVALVLRNFTRFVTSDYYIGKIEHVQSFPYQSIVGQKNIGDHTIYLAFATEEDTEGMLTLAGGFAHEEYEQVNTVVFDTLGEFSNLCSGLFATNMSEQNINIDMEPPFAYVNHIASGNAYVIPCFLHGKEVKLYIAVDDEIDLGKEPCSLVVEKQAGSEVTEESKAAIVIVDDSALMRRMLRNILEEDGYTVVCEAVNGAEGVEAYKKFKPDMITMDITMPVMDGIEALKEIKEYDVQAKVVMISAAGQQKKILEALKLGATCFITKPLNKTEVLQNIEDRPR